MTHAAGSHAWVERIVAVESNGFTRYSAACSDWRNRAVAGAILPAPPAGRRKDRRERKPSPPAGRHEGSCLARIEDFERARTIGGSMSRDVPARMGNRRRGGASTGRLIVDRLPARDCLRLTGAARFERKGGFEQAALDLDDRVTLCSVD